MSGVPRSQRLVAWTFTVAGSSPSFVCPQGYTTLVKSGYFYNDGATPVPVSLGVSDAISGSSYVIFYGEVPAANTVEWQGWTVLHPADNVFVSSGGAGVRCWIAGAVLAGSPQFAPAELADPMVFPPSPVLLPAAPDPPSSMSGLTRRRRTP